MKKVSWLLVLFMVLIGPVSAYKLYIYSPDQVNVGQTIKVTGNSTFPAGTSFDLVFYQAGYTATPIDRKTVVLQDYNNKTFAVAFPTKGLKGGQYKVEVQFDSGRQDQISSDSVTLRIIQVLDRSGEITMTSPLSQTLAEALRIEGSISKLGDAGVQLEVRGPNGPVFGPTWIETKEDMKSGDGVFTKKIPVRTAGDYEIQFTDARGFIGSQMITVPQPVTTATTTRPPTTRTTTRPPVTTSPPTTEPTKSPLSPIIPLLSLSIICGAAVLLHRKK